MAILIDFERVREDETTVEYRFGPPGNLNRTVVIRKDTQEATPTDGQVDGDIRRVMRKIWTYVQSRQTWPERGSYAA